jgi:hypothetical protein
LYPIDKIYGPKTYREFRRREEMDPRLIGRSLKATQQSAAEIFSDDPLVAASYYELVEIVSFLSVMNKRSNIYFRGQSNHWGTIRPTIFRTSWTSLTGMRHQIPDSPEARNEIWNYLGGEISDLVLSRCAKLPMPRQNTLKMFREAVWAIAQHYELWPTPLIDISPNLRVAASFALNGGKSNGFVYVFALPASTNSVTFDADQHVVLARLQAVCPPVAKRPHYQDGYLVGRFPFVRPIPNAVDSDPGKVSDLSRRLIARIELVDNAPFIQNHAMEPNTESFWSSDFPRMSDSSLLPNKENDRLLALFLDNSSIIDSKMSEICRIFAKI